MAPFNEPRIIPSTIQKESESRQKKLEFVHITKNGGSAIERAAAKVNITWGACHYMDIPEVGCYNKDTPYEAPDYQSYALTSPWHTPPKILKSRVKPKHNPYKDADLFAVVRNPYTRVISEYYCPWVGARKPEEEMNDPEVLNTWVKEMVSHLDTLLSEFNKLDPADWPKEAEWLLAQKHYLNQAEYFFDDGTQVINHIVYYENIQEDFNSLMQQYGLDMKLPDRDSSGVNKRAEDSQLTHLDLQPDIIALINKYAHSDFELFGYEMVDNFDGKNEYSVSHNK